MKDKYCPHESDVRAYLKGEIPEDRGREFEEHLAECPPCRDLAVLLGTAQFTTVSTPPSSAEPRLSRWLWPLGIAAAGVVFLTGGMVYLQRVQTTHEPAPIEVSRDGRVIRADTLRTADEIRTGDREMRWSSAGGTYRLSGGSALQVIRVGDRDIYKLDRGEIHVSVSGRQNGVRIETPAGSVEDVGTEFLVRAEELQWDGVWYPLSYVEVAEGKVLLQNPEGFGTVSAGHRRVMWDDFPPEGQVRMGREFTEREISESIDSLLRFTDSPLDPRLFLTTLLYADSAKVLQEIRNRRDVIPAEAGTQADLLEQLESMFTR